MGETQSNTTNQMERRTIPAEAAEMRLLDTDDAEGPGTLEGLGIVFNSRSVPLPGPGGERFVEIIRPEALDNVTPQNGQDVTANRNHDPDKLLGREANGTLELSVEDRGLHYRVQLPDTTVGRDTAELVRRGDLLGSSFTFSVAEGGDDWRREDGQLVREIHRLATMGDVGPVTNEAYLDTVVSARSLEKAEALLNGESRQMEGVREAGEVQWSGTETEEERPWGDVDKSFAAALDGYFTNTDAERPEEEISGWADAPQTARGWISVRTIKGDPNAETAEGGISFPVVNFATDNLNEGGVDAAKQRGSQTGDEDVVRVADNLQEVFEEEGSVRLYEMVSGEKRLRLEARQGMSDEDLRQRLSQALSEEFGDEDVFVWVAAVFSDDNLVVFNREESGGETGLFRVNFEMGGDEISFGEPEEVQRITTFEPVGEEEEEEGREVEAEVDVARLRRRQRQREAEVA